MRHAIKLPIIAVLCGLLALGLASSVALADDSGVGSGSALQGAGSASVPVVVLVPDPATTPVESATLLYRLYKDGHLVPALILLVFFGLKLIEPRVAWLRTGWRKLAVAGAFAGLAMIVERAANGATPNIAMVIGAIGAVVAIVVKGNGEPKPAEA